MQKNKRAGIKSLFIMKGYCIYFNLEKLNNYPKMEIKTDKVKINKSQSAFSQVRLAIGIPIGHIGLSGYTWDTEILIDKPLNYPTDIYRN
jgi:hypothetical protein